MKKPTNVYIIFVGNPEDKKPLLRPSRRWENNNKIGVTYIGRENMNRMEGARDRV
jgi:hypothetical protein